MMLSVNRNELVSKPRESLELSTYNVEDVDIFKAY